MVLMNNGNRYGNKYKYIYEDNNNANDNDKYKRWEIQIRMQNEILYKNNNNNNNVYIVCIKIKAIWQKRHTHIFFPILLSMENTSERMLWYLCIYTMSLY